MIPFESEVLSDAEIDNYFQRHRVFHSDSSVWPDDSGAVAEALHLGCDSYLRFVDDTLLAMLHRLNSLPRTDPFWDRNNRRPTVYKIPAFARMASTLDASDNLPIQALAVYDTFSCANDFGQPYWAALSKRVGFDIENPVRAALWNEVMVGLGPLPLQTFLVETSCWESAQALLRTFTQSHSIQIRDWANAVLSPRRP